MRLFFNTRTHSGETENETVTITDDDGNAVFLTESDWFEIGLMKGWIGTDDPPEIIEEVLWQ